MTERIYYVFCEDNCRFESMTKEQIYDAIAEATGATPTPVDDAFITKIKEQNAEHNIKVWKGTAAQYNALATIDADTLYFVDTNKVSNYEAAIEALQQETQPVNRGGTGATSAAAARTNLGLADSIIATGNTNGWNWTKWSSGKAQCIKTKTGVTQGSTEWRSGIYLQQFTESFPFQFSEEPKILLTCEGYQDERASTYQGSTTDTSCMISVFSSVSGSTCNVVIYAEGFYE